MIKTILWDFDGVILDSMKIKGDGFVTLFENYDKKYINEIEKYHYENGGISRFEKIKYFYENILKENIDEKIVLELADKFAYIIQEKIYNKNNLIDETVAYIKENYKNYNFHIVSGAKHDELNSLCEYFDLKKYFISIDGSPIKKDILVKNIIKKYSYDKQDIILIGDSINDFNATEMNNIGFYGYNNSKLKRYSNYIENFLEVKI